jgi:hypothetical protein
MEETLIYGLMAEFNDPEALVQAAQRTYVEGYRGLDAFSPFPVHGLAHAIGARRTAVPLLVLLGGLIGAGSGFLLQYWTAGVSYPINVGGRPYNSWPAFIPVTFEMTILLAAFAAVFGMLLLNGLPMPYHPVFNVPSFQLATRDRFFLLVLATDPKFDRVETRRFLQTLGADDVAEVEP